MGAFLSFLQLVPSLDFYKGNTPVLFCEWIHLFYLQVLSKKKLQDLVREIDPNEQLDEDVEEVRHLF